MLVLFNLFQIGTKSSNRGHELADGKSPVGIPVLGYFGERADANGELAFPLDATI